MPPKDPPQTPEEAEERRESTLRELSAEWDRKLECLKHPDANERIKAIMHAQGRTKVRPKAGETY
jgi:hypothetical protein